VMSRPTRCASLGSAPTAIGPVRSHHYASGDGSTPTEPSPSWGRQRRAWIEDRTDELAVAPYAAIGEERCARLRAVAKPWSVAMMSALG
jgi:hypothetical protein